MVKKIFMSVLWTVPFLSFVLGYVTTNSFFHAKEIQAPNFVGKSIQYSIREASRLGLNVRMLREKIDPDINEGIVLEQIPKPSHMVKPNQYVFVSLSKHPQGIVTPEVLDCDQKSIVQQTRKFGIRTQLFWLASNYPKGFCVAQFPKAGQLIKKRALTAYLSAGKNKLMVFPDLRGKLVREVKAFLEREGIKTDVLHTGWINAEHDCTTCTVVDQKPMAGSIVDTKQKLYVQLQVSY